ncbi:tRNA uridine-5-carboxymethylaminomethyl(34) synthesis GTPase MnmE [Sphingomonas arenae]|uniref:tRNA uridine-5-carboxymethylaminomethyl(34) synthesis GTPase MnmE n=1 Tax=Sphingomonas arenae TaxID=2812555 RepID=UPI0030132B36
MDTIFALSSGSPPAAIAIIRISGPLAPHAAVTLAGSLPEPRRASLRTFKGSTGEVLDSALVLHFPARSSVTGEPLVELHAHGGRAVVRAILTELSGMEGLREAFPGEFTRRAFENGRIDLTEAEGLADLLEAETELQRRAALAVAGGSVRRQVEAWRERLVLLSARAEAAIDYVGDEDEVSDADHGIAAEAVAISAELSTWLDQPRSELLKDGIRVVLAGPPNAGKSSLLNALVGIDKAIVTPVAGTTRDVIEVPLQLEGVPLVLVDTAGLHESADEVERIGVHLAEQQVRNADILLWLGNAELAPPHPRRLVVRSKADLGRVPDTAEGLAVSSVTQAGLRELKSGLVRISREILPSPDAETLNQRQATALGEAASALEEVVPDDIVLTAEALRQARSALDRTIGRAGVEDVLDALFGRFCLGK